MDYKPCSTFHSYCAECLIHSLLYTDKRSRSCTDYGCWLATVGDKINASLCRDQPFPFLFFIIPTRSPGTLMASSVHYSWTSDENGRVFRRFAHGIEASNAYNSQVSHCESQEGSPAYSCLHSLTNCGVCLPG